MNSFDYFESPPEVSEIKRRIANLIATNYGYAEIVGRAARLLSCPVSLWDHRGTVIASAKTTQEAIETVGAEFHAIAAQTCRTRDAVRFDLERSGAVLVAIAVADGCGPNKILLFAPLDRRESVETCRVVAPDLGFVVVVEAQRQRAVRTTEDRLRTSFRHELLDANSLAGGGLERLAERARALGYALAAAYWVVVAEARELRAGLEAVPPTRAFSAHVSRAEKRALTIEQEDRVVILIPESRVGRERFGALSESLLDAIRIASTECGAKLHAGLSEHSVAIGAIAAEVDRVSRNLDLNRNLDFRHELVVQEPIRPYRLLMAVAEPKELLEYWNETIRELYQYDVLNGTPLIRTLEVFFACNYNAIEASRRLYIHRNTMTRRLRRIEDTLHVDLNEAETAFRFQLAIRVHHIVISQRLHE